MVQIAVNLSVMCTPKTGQHRMYQYFYRQKRPCLYTGQEG